MTVTSYRAVAAAERLTWAGVAAAATTDPAGVDVAGQLAGNLLQQPGVRLQAAVAEGGAPGAIDVCTLAAPAIAGALSRRNRVKVARVSLRASNPLLGTPDAWEQSVLLDFERRLAAGEPVTQIEFDDVVRETAGEFLRYVKALSVQSLCLGCHGPTEDRAAGAGAPRGGVPHRPGDWLPGRTDPWSDQCQAAELAGGPPRLCNSGRAAHTR